jgi:nucleoside-diphosphate-sugar epimerase
MSTSPELHVVFGAGQIGVPLATRLAAAGYTVRLARRSATDSNLNGVQSARVDAADPASVVEAVRGAAVVYHCMNAAYSTAVWAAELPRLQANLVEAAGRAGARLVVLDNLYALGRPNGRPFDEASPLAPCSKKGEIRARLHEALEAAVRRGDVRAVTGRASDFYGPGGVMTPFNERFWPPVLAGKAAPMVMGLDEPHTYHFIPDVAAGLATLGLDPKAEGTYMLPCQPAESTRALAARFATALGRPIALSRMSPLLLHALSLFVPILREVREMAYQWEAPFVVADARFRARYGDRVTPRDDAARATVDWGVATFAPGARRAA